MRLCCVAHTFNVARTQNRRETENDIQQIPEPPSLQWRICISFVWLVLDNIHWRKSSSIKMDYNSDIYFLIYTFNEKPHTICFGSSWPSKKITSLGAKCTNPNQTPYTIIVNHHPFSYSNHRVSPIVPFASGRVWLSNVLPFKVILFAQHPCRVEKWF